MMQGLVYTWTEAQVEEKLSELCIEYRAVEILNAAMNLKRKSILQLSDDISNAFSNMKVPGTVIEKLDFSWIPTLKALYVISTTQWTKIDLTERKTYIDLLKNDAQVVWSLITSQKPLLEKYMDMHGQSCSSEELENIYNSLKTVRYDSLPGDFDSRIETQLQNVAYSRNKEKIQKLWKNQSEFGTVTEWCNNYAVPIQWISGHSGWRGRFMRCRRI